MLDCSCSCDIDEPATVFCERQRKARVAHRCCECGASIEPGNRYSVVGVLYDGKWNSYKQCWFCSKVAADFFGGCYYVCGLREQFQECFGWDYLDGPSDDDMPQHWYPQDIEDDEEDE